MHQMKEEIKASWEVTDMGEPTKFIHTENSIMISQHHYIESILKWENMTNCNPISTQMDPSIKVLPNQEGNEGSRSNYFTQLLGKFSIVKVQFSPVCKVFYLNPELDFGFSLTPLPELWTGPSVLVQRVMNPEPDCQS